MNNCLRFLPAYCANLKKLFPYVSQLDPYCNQNNLDNDEEKKLRYIGTYYPRTVAEYFAITNEVLSNDGLKGKLLKRTHLRILDWGCGQGGASWGVLIQLSKSGFNGDVTLIAFDGNENAMKSLKMLAEDFEKTYGIRINLVPFQNNVQKASQEFFDEVNKEERFDFILASKSLGEMGYLCGYKNTYGGFLRIFLDHLNEEGICIITDVNIKNGYTKQFQGTMLRTQVDEVLNNEKTSFVVIKENNKTLADGYYGTFEKDHEVFTTVFDGHTFNEPLCYRVITRRNVVEMN